MELEKFLKRNCFLKRKQVKRYRNYCLRLRVIIRIIIKQIITFKFLLVNYE